MLLRAFLVCWFLPGFVTAWIGTLILPSLSRSQQFTLAVILAAASGFAWARYVLPYLRRAQERAEEGGTLGTFPALLTGVIPNKVIELRALQCLGTLVASLVVADVLRNHVAEAFGETSGTICWAIVFPTSFVLLWRMMSFLLEEYRLKMLFARLGCVGQSADQLLESTRLRRTTLTEYEWRLLQGL